MYLSKGTSGSGTENGNCHEPEEPLGDTGICRVCALGLGGYGFGSVGLRVFRS